jgi:hypothetical protein
MTKKGGKEMTRETEKHFEAKKLKEPQKGEKKTRREKQRSNLKRK